MSRTERLAIALAVVLTATYFLVVIYPSVSDFDYWQMRQAFVVQRTGHVDVSLPFSGFYVLTAMMSASTGAPLYLVSAIPFELVPLTLLLAAVLRSSGGRPVVYIGMLLAYLTFGSNPSPLTWGAHELGFLLFLSFVLLTSIKSRVAPQPISAASTLGMIGIILSLNFMSYKMVFALIVFALAYALFSTSFRRGQSASAQTTKKGKMGWIGVLGLVTILTLSEFFYRTIVPLARVTAESPSLPGIEGILLQFFPVYSDPLSPFYLVNPPLLKYAKALWLALPMLGLLVFLVANRQKLTGRNKLQVSEKTVLGFAVSASAVLVVYVLLGFAEIILVVVAGLLALLALGETRSSGLRKFSAVSAAALLVLGFYVAAASANTSYLGGQRIQFHPNSLDAMSLWFLGHGAGRSSGGGTLVVASDVFTTGYFLMEFTEAGSNETGNLVVLSKDQIGLILGTGARSSTNTTAIYVYVVNSGEPHFTIFGWRTFVSWKGLLAQVNSNPSVNLVYDSGDLQAYT